jgi:hypothetical protein
MANTFKKIQTVTVGSGGSATMSFTSIPQTYTDLKIVFSGRSARTASAYDSLVVKFNSTATTYAARRLYGEGGSAGSDTVTTQQGAFSSNSTTANVFGSIEVYIPNYTSSNQKITSSYSVAENNDSSAYGLQLVASKWDGTGAITQIDLSTGSSSNFMQYTTATLYGVSNVTAAGNAKATGGIITYDDTYVYHTFPWSGTFTPLTSLTADYLVVAGGGSGCSAGSSGGSGGGGGAGGYRTGTLSLTTGAKTVTVGAGGASSNNAGAAAGNNGSNSVFDSITSTGGGGGGRGGGSGSTGNSGGSGGGADAAGGAGTSGQGNNGGSGSTSAPNYGTGGGGGASAVGSNGSSTTSGNGGAGSASSITGTSVTYAGGGGGGTYGGGTAGTGGSGGGGNGQSNAGTAAGSGTVNTGSGGGGAGTSGALSSQASGAGGSGIVIVRYAK